MFVSPENEHLSCKTGDIIGGEDHSYRLLALLISWKLELFEN